MIGDAERRRLRDADAGAQPRRAWVPGLSERAWATVREDYSECGTVRDSFAHDLARSRAPGCIAPDRVDGARRRSDRASRTDDRFTSPIRHLWEAERRCFDTQRVMSHNSS
jgi:hypothetical protein